MITRNEAHRLPDCLRALKALDAEIIVADSDSTDNTADIARSFGARVHAFSWCDDFSAARNFAAAKASSDIILAVDADEVLTDADTDALQKAYTSHDNACGMILRVSETDTNGEIQRMHERIARLYDRRLFCYHGTIHETLAPHDASLAFSFYHIPLTFSHSGYDTSEKRREKAKRDLRLLQTAYAADDTDPYLCYQIGKCHVALRQHREACAWFEKGLSFGANERLQYVREMAVAFGYALLECGENEKALSFLAQNERFADGADYTFLAGLILMNNARFQDAIDAFRRATAFPDCTVEGVNSFRALYNMGVIYEVSGDLTKAVSLYKQCGQFAPALARLSALSAS